MRLTSLGLSLLKPNTGSRLGWGGGADLIIGDNAVDETEQSNPQARFLLCSVRPVPEHLDRFADYELRGGGGESTTLRPEGQIFCPRFFWIDPFLTGSQERFMPFFFFFGDKNRFQNYAFAYL